jgi:6-phosphogluconolactonase/glucosamine-6-phosphate isomerase/deaminase
VDRDDEHPRCRAIWARHLHRRGRPAGDLDFRLGGIGAIGHPCFLIPGYQALLLVFPDDRLFMAVLTVAPSNVGIIEIPIIVADLIDALHS